VGHVCPPPCLPELNIEIIAHIEASPGLHHPTQVTQTVERSKRLMPDLLYKVSQPRDDLTFEPRPFWRAQDWSFSDDHPHTGLIEDRVLFAAQFDEINIHLLPKVWRLRVWLDDEERCTRLKQLGFTWKAGARAVIFALESDRESIEAFEPTVYAFDSSGFQKNPIR
jgi:hypothetical protein